MKNRDVLLNAVLLIGAMAACVLLLVTMAIVEHHPEPSWLH